MKISRTATLMGAALVFASCQSHQGGKQENEPTLGAISPASAKPQAYAIADSAKLGDLVAAALKHHPSLVATRARVSALEQSAIQSRSLPDPSANVGAGQMAETAAGQVLGTVGVQQKIPFPGKRKAAAAVPLRKAEAMRAQLSADELALEERVRSTYWDLFVATQTIAVVTESKAPLSTLLESVEARVATNKASQQDLLRLQNEITRLDQRLTTARGRKEAASATLNALLYRPSGSALPVARPDPLMPPASKASLLEDASSNHPEVLAAEARIAAAEAGVRLAELQKRPDFTAGVSYSPVSEDGLAPSANGRDQYMGTLGVTLPLWRDKNKAAQREAEAILTAEQSMLASTRSSLQQRIESAYASFRAEHSNLALYSDKLIPDAERSFDLSVTGYQTETSTFLDVIDAWRQLLNYRLEHEENRGRAGKADAALRFAAGLR